MKCYHRMNQTSCGDVPGLFWHPWWVYLMVLYSALLNGAALLAQILPYGVFKQPPQPKRGVRKKVSRSTKPAMGPFEGSIGGP